MRFYPSRPVDEHGRIEVVEHEWALDSWPPKPGPVNDSPGDDSSDGEDDHG